jgi:two-component system, LytTR family, response regulator
MKLRKINFSNILFLEADTNYTSIFYADGTKTVSSYNLGVFEKEIEDVGDFLKISKSTIINKRYLVEFLRVKDTGSVLLTNGYRIKVARRKLAILSAEKRKLFFLGKM